MTAQLALADPSPDQPVISLADSCRVATTLATLVLVTGREPAPLTCLDDDGTPVYVTHIDRVEITIRPTNQMAYLTAPGLAPRPIMTGPTGEVSGAQYDCLVAALKRAGLDLPEPTQRTMPRFARRQIFESPNYDGNGLLPADPPKTTKCDRTNCWLSGWKSDHSHVQAPSVPPGMNGGHWR